MSYFDCLKEGNITRTEISFFLFLHANQLMFSRIEKLYIDAFMSIYTNINYSYKKNTKNTNENITIKYQ